MAKSKKKSDPSFGQPLEGEALVKETCRRLRAAKGLWDAHRNAACRGERDRALVLYNQLTKAQKDNIPQQLRIWLRYRSEKYFGPHQTAPGSSHRSGKKRSKQRISKTDRKGKQRKSSRSRSKHTPDQLSDRKPLW